MRILHLLDEPWDSGITAYALQTAQILKSDGHHVVVAVRTGKKPEAKAKKMGLEIRPLNGFGDVRRHLKRDHWDVVNAHTGRSHTWCVIARALFKQANPKAALVRTRGDARPLKVHPLLRFVYRRTEAAIAASEHIRRQYELTYGMNEEQVRTIYPSVAFDETVTPPEPDTVGILGRLDPVKGHATFIEAAVRVLKQFPKAKFLIGGREANIKEDILKNQARELGINPSIHFLGFQESAQDFMRRCSVGVIASLGSEEISRACLEWMGVGRPVIGTIVGCLPELIDTQVTGLLVPPGDSTALGDAILSLLKDPSRAQKWGTRGNEIARASFDEKTHLEKTIRLYNWAISQCA